MKSSVLGRSTSGAEVQDITQNGIWVFVNGKEYMLPFSQYPWFKGAKVAEVLNLRLLHANHLYWPDLDVDLGLEVLTEPSRFPLMDRVAKKRAYRVIPR
ncbi:MAG: hypothetical protein KCHDKBKB_02869 [Elusimicrobia bacterium]|nr:hypothetical protein [Elusimicrobiota bacterium]